jgi:hypothetical protein
VKQFSFEDRNVDDASDGYVSCDSYKDNREWKHVEKMERGMQGVPILVSFPDLNVVFESVWVFVMK